MTSKLAQTPEFNKLLVDSGSTNREKSLAALHEFAKALELPLRKGVLSGDILDGIFESIQLAPGAVPEFPLDFLAPGSEKDHVAYTMPNHGYIPQRNVEGDFVMVPTYGVTSAIDWNLKYARNARWDIVGRAMEVLESGFTKKLNDDGWHTIISAAVDRNIIVFDSDAAVGQFTKRLISLGKTVMRRNGGGNSTSTNRGRLTDVYLSPEALEDIRNWNVDQVDEATRREIFTSEDGSGPMSRIFGINLHDIDELGEGQEYQLFYTSQLSGTLPTSDVEIMVGLDLSKNDSFVMPIDEPLQVFEDSELHRQRRAGMYAWQSQGFAALDNRRVVLLSI